MMVQYYKEFKTEVEALEYEAQIQESFPRWGYDTSTRVYYHDPYGVWVMSGYRSSSCD